MWHTMWHKTIDPYYIFLYINLKTELNDDDLTHLCVVCTHGPVAEQRTAGIAEVRVREGIVIYFVIPRFDQLQDRLIPVVDRENTVSTEEKKSMAKCQWVQLSHLWFYDYEGFYDYKQHQWRVLSDVTSGASVTTPLVPRNGDSDARGVRTPAYSRYIIPETCLWFSWKRRRKDPAKSKGLNVAPTWKSFTRQHPFNLKSVHCFFFLAFICWFDGTLKGVHGLWAVVETELL